MMKAAMQPIRIATWLVRDAVFVRKSSGFSHIVDVMVEMPHDGFDLICAPRGMLASQLVAWVRTSKSVGLALLTRSANATLRRDRILQTPKSRW